MRRGSLGRWSQGSVRNLGVLACCFLLACSSSSPKKDSRGGLSAPTPSVHASPQEMREYREIELLCSGTALEPAQAKIAAFQKRHPRSSLLPGVENLYGLILLRVKKSAQAALHFKKAVSLNPSNEGFNQYILYNLATAQLDAGQINDAQQTSNKIKIDLLDKPNQIKVYYLKASLAEKRSLPLEASRQILAAGRIVGDSGNLENKKSYYRLLERSLQNMNDLSSLEKLYHEFEDSPVADAVLYYLGMKEVSLGNRESGESHFNLLRSRFPQSTYYSQVVDLTSRTQSKVELDPRAVGVLLPLKGDKFGKFGTKSLQGIELAFGIFGPSDSDAKINLVVEDSGEEPEQALKALNRLVLKHHVVAVIGPMLTKGVDQVAQRAQELGVPLISLARKASPPMDYVFQAGLTQQLQAYEIARYAVQRLGAKRLAMIFPNDKYGLEIGNSFWDAVESLGGKIVGAESYNLGETDFRRPVDRLSGLYYTEARQRELDLLAKEREANKITKRSRKTEQYFQLKPIVDYDAVFIPDDAVVSGQILPTFAYRDVENVKFLGTSSWKSADFLSRVEGHGDQAIFVDAFLPESGDPKIRSFMDKYKATFNQDATPLEALAYDAGRVLQSILSSSSNLSREDVRDHLRSIRDFQGITGRITSKNNQFYRELAVIRVKDGHFVEAP